MRGTCTPTGRQTGTEAPREDARSAGTGRAQSGSPLFGHESTESTAVTMTVLPAATAPLHRLHIGGFDASGGGTEASFPVPRAPHGEAACPGDRAAFSGPVSCPSAPCAGPRVPRPL